LYIFFATEYMVNVQVALGSSSSGVDGKLYLALYGPNENSELKQLSELVSLESLPTLN